MGKFLNVELMRNPANWVIVGLMWALAAVLSQYVALKISTSGNN